MHLNTLSQMSAKERINNNCITIRLLVFIGVLATQTPFIKSEALVDVVNHTSGERVPDSIESIFPFVPTSMLNPCYTPYWGFYPKGNKCLYIIQAKLNWFQAQRYCKELSARLVTIPNQEMNVVVSRMASSAPVWIGLNSLQRHGEFHWEDNSKVGEFKPWTSTDPKGRPNACVEINAVGEWSVMNCLNEMRMAACEMEDVDTCQINNGGCDHECVPTTIRERFCLCEPGFELKHKTACMDVDECRISNGGCQHVCNNEDGSYSCTCYSGYNLAAGEKFCDTSGKSLGALAIYAFCSLVSVGAWSLAIYFINQERARKTSDAGTKNGKHKKGRHRKSKSKRYSVVSGSSS